MKGFFLFLILFISLIVFLFACSKRGSTSPVLVSLEVIPTNPAITHGIKQQFIAKGTYSDNSTQDLTLSATWISSNPSVATISTAGLAPSDGPGSTTITATSGSITGSTTLTVNPLALNRVKAVALTTDTEGGSARPEIISIGDRIYVVYLGNITGSRTFNVKVFDSELVTLITSTTIVTTNATYGGPTDIRTATDGQALYTFYETFSALTGTTYLWGAKYSFNESLGSLDRDASTPMPVAISSHMVDPPDGRELLDDPALLIGPNSVIVITRYDTSLATAGSTRYHVREFNKDTLVQLSERNCDLSDAADGRARVASFLFWNNTILAVLPTTVSNTALREDNDDGAQSDLVLVRMNQDCTFDALQDVRKISEESGDIENYVTGLKADSNYFYITYKQTVGVPFSGEHRAVTKIYDGNFNPVLKQQVKSIPWIGAASGQIRPSLEVIGNRILSGQSGSQAINTLGNADIYVYEKN